MITDKLLITTDYIKENTTISDNLNDSFLIPCLKDVQLSHLQPLIGTALFDKLFEDDLNEDYKYLIDNYISQFLLMAVQSELCISNFLKQHNAGAVSYVDTNYEQKNLSELKYIKAYWADKENFYGNRLTDYLHANHAKFPEYCTCRTSADMHSKDYSDVSHFGMNVGKTKQAKRKDK